ncbi:MAG: flagellar filament capping protein FliD, partial [Candidatus Eisenbacteria bacterium]|nr:flagellar filament capping protein FliD [Candidatus Eisenbacteria bacterium]
HQLATQHVLVSATWGADGEDLGGSSGRFRIAGAERTAEIDLSLEEGLTNAQALSRVAAAVNGSDAGVQASVVRAGGTVRLLLASQTGGREGIVRSVADLEGDLMNRMGLAGESAEDSYSAATIQSPQDAELTLDGLRLTAPSNRLEEILPGVTLTLRESGGRVEFEIAPDAEAARAALETFVNSYNALVDALSSATRAGGESTERGLLRGSVGVGSLQRVLRSALRSVGGADQPELRDLGLELDRTGRLSLSAESGSAWPEAAAGTSAGVLARLEEALAPFDGVTGILNREDEGLERRVQLLERRAQATEERLNRREEMLREQLAELQSLIIEIQAQQATLQQLGGFGVSGG